MGDVMKIVAKTCANESEAPSNINESFPEDPKIVNEDEIPLDTPLTLIHLPQRWVLYLYDKQLFKKMANRSNFQATPYIKKHTFVTMNDIMYFMKLMATPLTKNEKKIKGQTINLDIHDYIIMREGIEPIWEDPKNSCGGTFSIKTNHKNGFDIWTSFVINILGETLTAENHYINGITVSFITDNFHNPDPGTDYTYIKIWDGKQGRTKDDFVKILPPSIIEKIGSGTLRYTLNVEKPDYNGKDIMAKLNNNRNNNRGKQFEKGGFITPRGRR